MVPAIGAVGLAKTVNGKVLEHPSEVLVYVRVTEPAVNAVTNPTFDTDAIELLLDVHVPLEDGVTLAVNPAHILVVPPTDGAPGTELIITLVEAGEVQLFELVTVKVYVVLAGSPVMVKLVPEPVYVVPPGDLIMVHEPEAGSPLRITLPDGVVHVG